MNTVGKKNEFKIHELPEVWKMTYRDVMAQDKLNLNSPLLNGEADLNPLKDFMNNQSPIMKVWFVVMAINMVMFLFLIH
jgi:hypothetical protein